jgi:hypothetical protein
MKKRFKILYNSYFIFIAVPVILIIVSWLLEIPLDIAGIIGFGLGSIYGFFSFKFSYIDKIWIENDVLHIESTNAFLQSRKNQFEIDEMSNVKIFYKKWYNDFGRIEFNIEGMHKRYSFFKTEQEMLLRTQLKDS